MFTNANKLSSQFKLKFQGWVNCLFIEDHEMLKDGVDERVSKENVLKMSFPRRNIKPCRFVRWYHSRIPRKKLFSSLQINCFINLWQETSFNLLTLYLMTLVINNVNRKRAARKKALEINL